MGQTPIRYRALLTGLVLVILFCAFTPYNNVKLQNSPLAVFAFKLSMHPLAVRPFLNLLFYSRFPVSCLSARHLDGTFKITV